METSLTSLTVRTQDEVLVTLPLNEKDGGREVSRNSKSSRGSSGPPGDMTSGQTQKKAKDLSVREGEECVRGGVGGCML
jgi:hypothetical protein